jgi:hypothetical protein
VGRDGCTSDGGFPRRTACNYQGICPVSLNDDIVGLHSDIDASEQPKWKAPEIKPRIEDKAWDDSILLDAGLMIFKESINEFTDAVQNSNFESSRLSN